MTPEVMGAPTVRDMVKLLMDNFDASAPFWLTVEDRTQDDRDRLVLGLEVRKDRKGQAELLVRVG